MSIVNLLKTAAANFIHGFGVKSKPGVNSFQIAGFNLGAGASSDFTGTSVVPSQEATSITMAQFNGVSNSDIDGYWIPMNGIVSFRCSAPSFDVYALLQRTASGQVLKVRLTNTTGVTQSIPTLTINFKSIFYDAPW